MTGAERIRELEIALMEAIAMARVCQGYFLAFDNGGEMADKMEAHAAQMKEMLNDNDEKS